MEKSLKITLNAVLLNYSRYDVQMAKYFVCRYLQKTTKKGGPWMVLIVIFALVTILAAIGTIKCLKSRNVLGLVFAAGSFLMFGAFTVATLLTENSVPVAH